MDDMAIIDSPAKGESGGRTAREIGDILPTYGFIPNYLGLYEEITESPAEFHLATALTVLAGVAGPNLYYDFSTPLHPNIYSIIVGPSGTSRKTSALGIGQRYFSRIRELKFPESGISPSGEKSIDLLPEIFSQEALVDELEGNDCTGFVSEYRNLLGSGSGDYQSKIAPLLTALYDCPDTHKVCFKSNRRGGGGCSKVIRNPVISLIGATSPEYFNIKSCDAAGGFLGRHLVFYSPGTDKVIPFPRAPEARIVDGLERGLLEISNLRGKLTLSPEAMRVFETSYCLDSEAYRKSAKKTNTLGSFHSRKNTFWYKVSALLQISENCSLEVSGDNMRRAITIVDRCSQSYQWLLSQMGSDAWQTMRREIQEYIQDNPGCTKSEITRAFQGRRQTREGVLKDLLEAELVSATEKSLGKRGKTSRCYYPTSRAAA